MPSVMDAPELIEYLETHDLTLETLERPQPRPVHPGFWRTLVHRITPYLTPKRREHHTSSCSTRRPYEAPTDLLARQYPTLYLRALCGI
jgi:hypothetical protein